jgi:hypothetical protein
MTLVRHAGQVCLRRRPGCGSVSLGMRWRRAVRGTWNGAGGARRDAMRLAGLTR